MFHHSANDEMHFDIVERLYRSEYQHMIDFASYLLRSENLAEAAVQDTFVCALKHIQKLEESPNQVGWLYNTLKNIIRHMLRDRQLLLKNVAYLDEVQEAQLAASDRYSLTFVGQGDPKEDPELRLLVRFYLYGYSLQELAAQEKKTVGAIKMRIKRARERVKEKYHLK